MNAVESDIAKIKQENKKLLDMVLALNNQVVVLKSTVYRLETELDKKTNRLQAAINAVKR